MSEKMIEIPVSELLASLEEGYKDYKQSLADDTGDEDLGHVKGYCV